MFLLLTQTFSKWLMVAEYNINKEYIAKNLCENRNKPALHCNGKCQLMKKMSAEENQPLNSSGNVIVKVPFSEVWLPHTAITISSLSTSTNSIYDDFYLLKKSSPFLSQIFRPPLA
jgi:hypothetical protein